jgi:hypothetical protein
MTTIYKIIIGALLGGVIVFVLLWKTDGCKHKKDIAELTKALTDCRNAPTKTDTIWRYDTVIINKIKVLTQYKTDTIIQGGHIIEVNYYKDTLRTKDFDLYYGIKTIGTLKEVDFPWYRLHTREIVTTRLIDTCLQKQPEYKPKNHLGMDINLIGNNVRNFPNMDAILWWSVKDKWRINAGGEYNIYHGEAYVKIGVGIYFK